MTRKMKRVFCSMHGCDVVVLMETNSNETQCFDQCRDMRPAPGIIRDPFYRRNASPPGRSDRHAWYPYPIWHTDVLGAYAGSLFHCYSDICTYPPRQIISGF